MLREDRTNIELQDCHKIKKIKKVSKNVTL